MTLHLRYAAKSDVGMVRKDNEDSGFAGRTLLAVADGMGGHAAGELASSTAIATLAELDSEELTGEDVLTALDDAIVTSAERIAQFVQADPSRAGMGTTVTAIAWRSGRIAVIHVGDSRAYLMREGTLSQITRDHTYVQSLVDAGRITAEEARRHPKRNLMLRAIDGNQIPERDLSIREALAGDRYLLCSDGLCGVVEDAELARVLREVPDPTAAVTELVDLALEAGAPDNVTAVVADVIDVPDEADWESSLGMPVVVGAAGEKRNRAALPGLLFPDDVGLDPDSTDPDTPVVGPAVPGGLAMRGADRSDNGPASDSTGRTGAERAGAHGRVEAPPASTGAGAAAGQPAGGSEVGPEPRSPAAAVRTAEATWPEAAQASADAEQEPAEGRAAWPRRHWRGLTSAAVALTSVLIGVVGFGWWLGSQWFVGVESGFVAIYQGVPQQAFGLELNRVAARTALPASGLPIYDRQQLEATIDAATRLEADRIVADLAQHAAECAADPAPEGCPGTEEPGAGPGAPSESPTPLASPSPSRASEPSVAALG